MALGCRTSQRRRAPQWTASFVWVIALCILAALPHTGAVAMRSAAASSSTPSSSSSSSNTSIAAGPTTRPPFTLIEKKLLCQKDFDGYNRALELIHVDPEPRIEYSKADNVADASTSAKYPRIFCYVNTISPYHKSHAQLVADTWAQRCDKTVFFSNDTGVLYVNQGTDQEMAFDVVKMHAPADYWHLWMKHKEVLTYIHDHYRHDFDWFYKADDDAYVIVDNLRAYLRRPEIVNNHKRQPMQLGKRFNLTVDRIVIQSPELRKRWWQQWDRLVFNSGGPGYALNRLFLDKFVANMHKKSCLAAPESSTQPEDTSTTFCMMWEGVVPWDTRDHLGRPRWHPDSPGGVYGMLPEWAAGYWFDFNLGVGGFKYGKECCSSQSIGFHYVKKGGMHHMERMLYFCRTGDDVPDIHTFNRKFNLAISHTIVDVKS